METIISEEIIKKALITYSAKNTRYLTTASISQSDNVVKLNATFSIKESCICIRLPDILMQLKH